MTNNAQPSGVIFDVDGTLVDTIDQHADAWRTALSEHGFTVPIETIKQQYGKRNLETIQALVGNEIASSLVTSIDMRKVELFRRNIDVVQPFPGAHELIVALREAGIRVAVSSSAEPDDLRRFLEILAVDQLISDRVSSADVKHSKPDPESFDLIVGKWGFAPRDVVVIGDSVFDMQAASALGCFAIAVLTGRFPDHLLREAGARRIFGSVLDIYRGLPNSSCLSSE